jgi:glutamyl-tRNA reductase
MLISIAVDFRHADVATRERFHLSDDRIARLYEAPRPHGVEELAVVATCNRTELYAWTTANDAAGVDHAITGLVRRWMGTRAGARSLLAIARRRSGMDAAEHVFRVASGLESQVLGDNQILGQLRAAYKAAAEAEATGPILHRLFATALRTGKRVQTETSLFAGRNSVGSEAAHVALRRFGRLTHARVLIVGCGKTGERAARQVRKLGGRDLVLINRSLDRAVGLALELDGRAAPWDSLHCELAMADIAIVATASPTAVVQAGALARGRENCGTAGYPLLLLDLGVPRNVDPLCAHQPQVTIVDLDSLHAPLAAAEEMRRSALPSAEEIVLAELSGLEAWLHAAKAREAIRPLREALVAVARREVAYAAGDASADRTAERIVAKLLARPMRTMRQAIARGEDVTLYAQALEHLFDDLRPAPAVPLTAPAAAPVLIPEPVAVRAAAPRLMVT